MGGISIWQLLIIAVIIIFLFGANRLRTLGSDLGAAIKGFKKALDDTPAESENSASDNITNYMAFTEKKSSEENEPSAVKNEQHKNDHKNKV